MQAQTEVLSSDLTLTTGLLDRLGTECRERLAAVKAETHIERLRVLNALLFGPREQSNRCVAQAVSPACTHIAVWLVAWEQSRAHSFA